MKRKIFFFSALFLLSMSVWCEIKILYGPYLQNVKETEVTIVWESDVPSVGWVELAPNDGSHFYSIERPRHYDTTNGVKNVSQLHAIKIVGLNPGTVYRYRVYSQEVLSHKGIKVKYGDVVATNVYSKKPLDFVTNDASKKNISFLMINDIHGRSNVLKELLEISDYKEKDIVFFNGDMVSEFKDRDSLFSGFMQDATTMFAAEKPMYYARGNHETRGEFATSFQKYFSPKESNLYYIFRHGPVCFIVLDTGEDKPDSDIEYSGITDYDNYRTQQSEWIATLHNNEIVQNSKYKVVIAHIPPLVSKDNWHGQIELLEKVVPQLNKLGIDIMFCGHLHKIVYSKANETVKFPVVVNSNNSVLDVNVNEESLEFRILDIEGKIVLKDNIFSNNH